MNFVDVEQVRFVLAALAAWAVGRELFALRCPAAGTRNRNVFPSKLHSRLTRRAAAAVPVERGHQAALRGDAGRPVPRARAAAGRQGVRHRDGGQQRGDPAGGAGVQDALAGAARGGGPAARAPTARHGPQHAGVLGEGVPLLRGGPRVRGPLRRLLRAHARGRHPARHRLHHRRRRHVRASARMRARMHRSAVYPDACNSLPLAQPWQHVQRAV